MELKVFRETVKGYGGKWENRLELPVETEILIPDYLPAVFKIIKCRLEAVTMQNRVTAAHWRAEGYLRCTVYYESEAESGRFCRIEQKIPFEKALELPTGIYREGPANVTGETEYCNCRAVNEHRVEVRGAYILCATVPEIQECEMLRGLADCGVEQRERLLRGWQCATAEEVTVTTETPFPLPEEGAVVLDIVGSFLADGCTVQNGQVNCSGTLQMQVCSRLQNEDELTVRQKEIPTRQTVEIDRAEQGNECVFWGEVLACTITAPESQGEPRLSVTWKLHVELWHEVEYRVVADAYSTCCEMQTVQTRSKLLQRAEKLDGKTRVVLEDALPRQNLTVKGCFVTVTPPGVATSGQETQENGQKAELLCLCGKGVAHIICVDEHGELCCFDKSFTWQSEGSWPGAVGDACPSIYSAVTGVHSEKNGDMVRITIEIQTTGTLFLAESYEALCEVELGEEYADIGEEPALHLYYASEGELLFTIAKRYHARAKDIVAANHLEPVDNRENNIKEYTTGAGCLLVPAAR